MSWQGSIKRDLRERLISKYSHKCGYCGEYTNILLMNFIHPQAKRNTYKGVIHEEENLMPACASCNRLKSAFTLEEFRRELSLQLKRARAFSTNYKMAEKFGLVKPVENKEIKFYFETMKEEKSERSFCEPARN